MKIQSEQEIVEALEAARAETARLEKFLADRVSLPAGQRLAIDLHQKLCLGQGIGRCDWGNGGSWDSNYEMKEYLKKAEEILEFTSAKEALAILAVATGR